MNLTLQENKRKLQSSAKLLIHSLQRVDAFDPKKDYTPQELEPYDALTSRFIRFYEMALQYFRTYDYVNNISPTDNFRDLIHYMHKQQLIDDENTWFEMRVVRNKITHDYLPIQIEAMYHTIITAFATEVAHVNRMIEN